jgi:hypothetical protein
MKLALITLVGMILSSAAMEWAMSLVRQPFTRVWHDR